MNRIVAVGLPAAGLVALGAVTSSLLGVGVAGAAPAATTAKPATFQMYANVDAESDLGSNSGAVSAKPVPGSSAYFVTFKKPIGHCAAVVQPGKAGGSDNVDFVDTIVSFAGPNTFSVAFGIPGDNGTELKHEPFMMTVTCKN